MDECVAASNNVREAMVKCVIKKEVGGGYLHTAHKIQHHFIPTPLVLCI